jgi:hypothetical protein
MAIPLRQSTASQEIPLGFMLDSGDGNTEETTLTIANTDIKLWKNGAITLADKNSGGATHISNGLYYCTLDATDSDTLGSLVVFCHVSGALPVRTECVVLPANVYDALIAGSDKLDVDAYQVTAGAITAAAIATDAIDGDAIAASAVSEIQSGLATAAALSTVDDFLDTEMAAILAAVDTEVASILSVVNNIHDTDLPAVKSDTAAILADTGTDGVVVAAASKTGYTLSAAGVQAIWDALTSALTTVGSVGKRIVDNLDAAVTSRLASASYTAPPTVVQVRQEMDANSTKLANLDAAVSTRLSAAGYTAPPTVGQVADAVWDEALSGHVGAGSAGSALSTASSGGVDPAVLADAIWDEALSGHATAGTAGKKLTDLANADLSGVATAANLATVDTVVDAIKAKTDNLPTDPASNTQVNTRLATAGYTAPDNASITAIKAQTDKLAFAGIGPYDVKATLDGETVALTAGHGLAVDSTVAKDATVAKAATALSNATWTDSKAANLDAAVSTRLASGSYTAPDNASITAIKAKTDNLPASPAATGDIPTVGAIADAVWDEDLHAHAIADSAAETLHAIGSAATVTPAEIADAVWDEAKADHVAPGSTGQALNAAGANADPLLNEVPGSYAAGTAGAALGQIGSGLITTISPIAAGGAITIMQGDDYSNSDGRALDWTDTDAAWPTLTGATITFGAERLASGVTFTKAGSVVTPTGTKKVRVELTAAETATLAIGPYSYQVEAVLTSGRVITLASGTMTVQDDIA